MKVLVLSPYSFNIVDTITRLGDEVFVYQEKINPEFIASREIDYIVSFGYRHIITPETLDAVRVLSINLHISFLPFNRGTHPNLWSNIEDTPSGVTIHLIDEGLDTGNILLQKEVPINQAIHTFASSYKLLIKEIELLFDLNWYYLRTGKCSSWEQQGEFTFHTSKEAESLIANLPNGWDTNISFFKQFYSSGL